MGWASGSGLAEEVWELVRKHVPKSRRKKIANEVYELFCAQDADDWDYDDDLLKDAGITYETEYGDDD